MIRRGWCDRKERQGVCVVRKEVHPGIEDGILTVSVEGTKVVQKRIFGGRRKKVVRGRVLKDK